MANWTRIELHTQAVDEVDLESYNVFALAKKTQAQIDKTWTGSATELCVSLGVGLGFHFLPRLLGFIFPINQDHHIGSEFRTRIRMHFEGLANHSEKTKSIFKVVIPDNIGLATGLISLYFYRKRDPFILSNVIPSIGLTLVIIAALHQIRFISLTILAPLSRDYLPSSPGKKREAIFKFICPSQGN